MLLGYLEEQIRAGEQIVLARGVDLMSFAARAVSDECLRLLRNKTNTRVYGRSVAVLVGPGDNGGDGLFAGANLARAGVQVNAYLLSERAHSPGLRAAKAGGVKIFTLDETKLSSVLRSEVLIDAFLGLGARGELRGPGGRFLASLAILQQQNPDAFPKVLAVDLPSGVDANTGQTATGVLRANCSVTFGVWRAGMLQEPGRFYCGQQKLAHLPGVAQELQATQQAITQLEVSDLKNLQITRPAQYFDHKYTRGVLGVLAGCPQYPGAAVLAVGGALSVGVGMVRVVAPPEVATLVLNRFPQVVVAPGKCQAWVIGPGVGGNLAVARSQLIDNLTNGVATVLDASGLGLIGVNDQEVMTFFPLPPNVVLTPHQGELLALLQRLEVSVKAADISSAPLFWAKRLQSIVGGCVLLKGATTLVVSESAVFAQGAQRVEGAQTAESASPENPARLATAGTGDVLSGVIGALLASHVAGIVKTGDRVGVNDDAQVAKCAAAGVILHQGVAKQVMWLNDGSGVRAGL